LYDFKDKIPCSKINFVFLIGYLGSQTSVVQGNEASFVVTRTTGVIFGAMSFSNEYVGNTFEPTLVQASQLREAKIKTATVDRGYRGNTQIRNQNSTAKTLFKKADGL
jgi:hypothetical protein